MDIIQNEFCCFVLSNYGGNFPHYPLLTQCGMDIIQMDFVALFLVIEITNYIAYPEMSDISSYGGLSLWGTFPHRPLYGGYSPMTPFFHGF